MEEVYPGWPADSEHGCRDGAGRSEPGVRDLNASSMAMLRRMTQEQADQFDAVGQEKEREAVGKSATGRTHLNPNGQKVFGRIVADAVVRTEVELGPDVAGVPMRAAAH